MIELLMFEVAGTGDTGWDEIQEIAKGAGVDYRMESWLSGVPFDVVLAD